jgi:hypothetical protein
MYNTNYLGQPPPGQQSYPPQYQVPQQTGYPAQPVQPPQGGYLQPQSTGYFPQQGYPQQQQQYGVPPVPPVPPIPAQYGGQGQLGVQSPQLGVQNTGFVQQVSPVHQRSSSTATGTSTRIPNGTRSRCVG